VAAFGASDAAALSACGRRWGSSAMLELARLANTVTPVLRSFDAKGFRRDIVEFHPAYHALMAESVGEGLHASTWQADGKPAPAPAQVARAARFYMAAQVESGHLCPITMTRASVAALVTEPALIAKLMPVIASREYDPSFRSWTEKAGMTLGMGMTEKQGGTDVRANTTTAGRMSLVGPRPHAVAHNEEYRQLISGYMLRHKVTPGITGLAQVNGCRGETACLEDMVRRVQYDIEYMRRWCWLLDMRILFRTLVVVLFKRDHAY
jgi:hypothetical protein